MDMAVISGDGVFPHLFPGANDVEASVKFDDAALGALGVRNLGPVGNGWTFHGKDKSRFIIAKPGNGDGVEQWRDQSLRSRDHGSSRRIPRRRPG